MIDIEDALNRIFRYKRSESTILNKLCSDSLQIKNEFNNIAVKRPELGFYGNIHLLADFGGRQGRVMAHYTSETLIDKNVNEFGKLSPEYMGILDNAFNHLGVLMNCLAYLSKQSISRLTLVQLSNCTTHSVNIRSQIAELFLQNIKKMYMPLPEAIAAGVPRVTGSKKTGYRDRQQTSIFS